MTWGLEGKEWARERAGVKVIPILYPLGTTAELFLWTQGGASSLKLWEESPLV